MRIKRPGRFVLGSLALLVVSLSLWAAWGHFATAQTTTTFSIESIGSKVGLGDSDLVKVVFRVINYALGFLTFVALVFVMYGGFLWLTASGDERRIEKAKRVILQALIGLVIVLLAWAIVLFVARFFKTATTTGEPRDCVPGEPGCEVPCLPGNPECPLDPSNTFNVTAIATCAVAPDYSKNVPRGSNIAVYFNNPVDPVIAEKAVVESKNLITKRCGGAENDPTCTTQNTDVRPVDKQIFSLNQSSSTEANPTAEWIAKTRSNAMSFRHVSYSTTSDDAKNQLFEQDRTYRLHLPMKGAANELRDQSRFKRPLEHCQSEDGGPIPGDTVDAKKCVEDTANQDIYWSFTTGEDIEGPPISVDKTAPRSDYISDTGSAPDRDVDRDSAICVYFSSALDPISVDSNTFTVTPFTTRGAPTETDRWRGGTLEASPLPATDFTEPYFVNGGRGVCIKPKNLYEAFRWYQVKVKDVLSLCGAVMQPNPYPWVFESNDRVPGIEKLYPADGFDKACPATKVKAVFRTSMWNGESSDCDVGLGSYVQSGSLKSGEIDAGRAFKVGDPWRSEEPNKNCRVYEFVPTSVELKPDLSYNGTVLTNRQISTDGKNLEVGTPGSGKPWSFRTTTVDKCVQPPLITRVSPTSGKNGQCVSVIGDYFETKSETVSNGKPEVGDGLTLGGRNQLTDPDVTWTDTSIVSVVDAGAVGEAGFLERGSATGTEKKYTYKVTVKHPAPINELSDELTDAFALQEGDGSEGPCLLALSRTSGPPGTSFDAIGKRFGDASEDSRVEYPLAPPPRTLAYGTWTPTRISRAKIPSATTLGRAGVSVVSSSGLRSNEIDFETTAITTPTAGAPRVDESNICDLSSDPPKIPSPSPREGDADVCLNTHPEARFTKPMDPDSLRAPGAIVLEDCSSGPCAAVADTRVEVWGDNYGFTLIPSRLQPAHKYRMTINGDVQSGDRIRLGEPYDWNFTTKADSADCPIAAITIRERSQTFRTEPFSYPMTSATRDVNCREVEGSCASYEWKSSDPTVAVLAPTNAASTTAQSADPISVGTTKVTVACQEKTSRAVSLTYDPTSCTADADCRGTNRFDESCGESSCVAGRCAPVITTAVPKVGGVGSWVSIHGCWFGAYVADQSKVIFGSDQGEAAREAPPFPASICDDRASWQNDYVIRAVPEGAVGGKVKVIRAAGGTTAEAESIWKFGVGGAVTPGLCKIVPSSARPEAGVTAVGTGFGSDEPSKRPAASTDVTARDAVFMTKAGDGTGASRRAATPYSSWGDQTIGTSVPADAAIGFNSVIARNDGVESNDVLFQVGDTSAGRCIPCADDGVCPDTDDGKKQGCSVTTHCCAPKPVLISSNPAAGATGICRNAAPELTFSQPLDAATVTADSTRYTDGGFPVEPRPTVRNSPTSGTIAFHPGLLRQIASQEISLVSSSSTPVEIENANFEGSPVGETPTGWPVTSRAKTVAGGGNGSSGKSALVDCAGCTGVQQAFIAQDIKGPDGELLPANSLYRIQVWVKTDQPEDVKAGFVTQCLDRTGTLVFEGCTFEQGSGARGTSTEKTDWERITIYTRNNIAANLRLTCFANAGAKTWCDGFTVEKLSSLAPTIRGRNGVAIDPTGTPLSFTTGAGICEIDHVAVTPVYTKWESQEDRADLEARGISQSGVVVVQSDAYRWDWSWLSSREQTARIQATVTSPFMTSAGLVYGGTIGVAKIEATAKIKHNDLRATDKSSYTGRAKIDAKLCPNNWVFADSVENCDARGTACPSYDFRLEYCRGTDARSLLPDFSYLGKGDSPCAPGDTACLDGFDGTYRGAIEGKNASLGRLKSYFFKTSADATDVIGLLIYANPDFLSPAQWYAKRFPSQAGGGSETTMGGFPALTVGSTSYVAVSHLVDRTLEGLMFVFDYNANQADSLTKTVYTQIIENLSFNTNLASDLERGQLQRDTVRRLNLSAIAASLETYKSENGNYPPLSAGSYITGVSTSRWPSWRATLGTELKMTMPSDPDNSFARQCSNDPTRRCTNDDQCLGGGTCGSKTICSKPYENATCWAESTKSFTCPTGSSVYLYRASTTSFNLFARMEYTGPGSFANHSLDRNACGGLTGADCRCFNYAMPLIREGGVELESTEP